WGRRRSTGRPLSATPARTTPRTTTRITASTTSSAGAPPAWRAARRAPSPPTGARSPPRTSSASRLAPARATRPPPTPTAATWWPRPPPTCRAAGRPSVLRAPAGKAGLCSTRFRRLRAGRRHLWLGRTPAGDAADRRVGGQQHLRRDPGEELHERGDDRCPARLVA